jgi:hypothetical protein
MPRHSPICCTARLLDLRGGWSPLVSQQLSYAKNDGGCHAYIFHGNRNGPVGGQSEVHRVISVFLIGSYPKKALAVSSALRKDFRRAWKNFGQKI